MANYVLHAEPGHINLTGTAFMSYGNRYREVAELWMQNSKHNGKFDPVSYQLMCQSVELYLKSFIWLTDQIGNRTIKNKYGHDLCKLWRHSKERGINKFASVTELRERTINLLGPYYKDRKFCYLDIEMVFEGFQVLDSEPKALIVLNRLSKQLGKSLRTPILRAS